MTVLMTADAIGGIWTHALDLSRGLSARGIVDSPLAVQGIGLVITTNIVTKLALARVGGRQYFGRLAPSLIFIVTAWWLGWWWG